MVNPCLVRRPRIIGIHQAGILGILTNRVGDVKCHVVMVLSVGTQGIKEREAAAHTQTLMKEYEEDQLLTVLDVFFAEREFRASKNLELLGAMV